MAHFFFEPLLVNGSDLFEQNDRILGKPEFLGAADDVDVGGQTGLDILLVIAAAMTVGL